MQSIDQVPGNNCVYSPTYLMLRIELLSVVLEIQNKNADTLNMDVVCGQKKNKLKGHSKINDQIKHKLNTWITCHPQVL